MKKLLYSICYIASMLIFETSMADEVKMYNSPPTAEELSRELFPDPQENEAKSIEVKTRSISFGTKKAKPVITEHYGIEKHNQKSKRSGIGLPIQFGYNSAEILSESDAYLDQIGIMMGMEKMAKAKLLIEGHTDTSGSDEHNKILSQARAEAVKNYLISKHNVNPYKLVIIGMGESRPLRNKDTNDPLNRRVEFYRAD